MSSEFDFILEDTLAKSRSILSNFDSDRVRIAYSGGSDSDVVIRLVQQAGFNIKSVFYNTGIEWQATLDHVEYTKVLGFEIDTIKAYRPVPLSNKKYGHPFISKQVSEFLERLQKHDFKFQEHGNLPFSELWELYPRCKAALRWWTNNFGHKSRFNIEFNPYLKEFLIEYGLPFKVSGKCCDGAKKLPMKQYIKKNGIGLVIVGIRKSEGGSRVGAYSSCYTKAKSFSYDMYRPIFFWSNEMKLWYTEKNNILHSKCYAEYGLKRTGCAGCPFGLKFEDELNMLEKFEPKLANGIKNIFAPSYEWTRKYRKFKKEKSK